MRRKLRTTLLGAILSLGICLLPTMTAVATEQTDPVPAESEVPQEGIEAGNTDKDENTVTTSEVDVANEEGQCRFTDVKGRMVKKLDAGQTYKFHLRIQVVDDVDAKNASAFWQLVLIFVICGIVGGLAALLAKFVTTSLRRRIKRENERKNV